MEDLCGRLARQNQSAFWLASQNLRRQESKMLRLQWLPQLWHRKAETRVCRLRANRRSMRPRVRIRLRFHRQIFSRLRLRMHNRRSLVQAPLSKVRQQRSRKVHPLLRARSHHCHLMKLRNLPLLANRVPRAKRGPLRRRRSVALVQCALEWSGLHPTED